LTTFIVLLCLYEVTAKDFLAPNRNKRVLKDFDMRLNRLL